MRDRDGRTWRQEDERLVKAIFLLDKGSGIARRGAGSIAVPGHARPAVSSGRISRNFQHRLGWRFCRVRPREPGPIQLPSEPPSAATAQPTLGPLAPSYTVLQAPRSDSKKTHAAHTGQNDPPAWPWEPPKALQSLPRPPRYKTHPRSLLFYSQWWRKRARRIVRLRIVPAGPCPALGCCNKPVFFCNPSWQAKESGEGPGCPPRRSKCKYFFSSGWVRPGDKISPGFPSEGVGKGALLRAQECSTLCPVQKNPRALLFLKNFSVKGFADRHGHSVFKSAANLFLQVLFVG